VNIRVGVILNTHVTRLVDLKILYQWMMESSLNMKNERIGEHFRNIRIKLGFSQKQIADFIYINIDVFRDFEDSNGSIGVCALEKGCVLFGCEIHELETYEPNFTIPNAEVFICEDMEAIYTMHKIKLNLRRMKKYED
jgi:transcriptional regulator with XRE-family HTH domain